MKIKGFTPAVDVLTDLYGGVRSLIYGSMWRFAQMSSIGLCTASQEKIGKRAGVERETVNRHIPIMIKDKLIEKAGSGPGGTVAYKCLVDLSSVFQMTVTENHPLSDDESQGDVMRNHTKKDIKKDIKKDYSEAVKRGIDIAHSIRGDFEKYLGLTPNWDTKSNQAHYLFFRERYDVGQTVKDFAKWWKSDWKGKDGSLPSSLNQVRTLWMQAFIISEDDLEAQNKKLKELHG